MRSDNQKMVIGIVMRGTGTHLGGWRHPSVSREALGSLAKLSHYKSMAKACEDAKMHFIFLADSPTIKYQRDPLLLSRTAQDYYLEPLTLISALSVVTEKIGLVASASTTYNEPYTVARMFSSLDHLSEGRASWNVVTSFDRSIAQNYSQESHMEKPQRYDRAEEFVHIVKGLWDSWEDDAFPRDQASGVFTDPAKMHFLNFRSEQFQVRGPLDLERSPQGHPVIFLAGSSEGARNLAAKEADAMFTAQPVVAEAQKFYADVKSRLAQFQREKNELAIVPGAQLIVGKTMKEAKEKHEYLRSLLDVDFVVQYLSVLMEQDLSGYPLDKPLPDSIRQHDARSRVDVIMDMAARDGLTFREIAVRYADQYGHEFIVGDPISIADDMQANFKSYACDGYVLRSPYLPDGLNEILTMVIPELQNRGLYRSDYEGTTFRDNLGLKRRPHQKPS